jgi:hypothetical protein
VGKTVKAAEAGPARRAAAAQRNVVAAHARVANDLVPLCAAFARHRSAWIVGGGLVSGFALAFLPRRLWSGIGALLGGTAALVARSVVAPMIAGAIVARERPAGAAEVPAE